MGKEDLFDGIQIMSPSEIESSLENSDEGISREEHDNTEQTSSDEFEIIALGNTGTSSQESSTEEPRSSTDPVPTNTNAYSALIKDMIKEGVITGPEGDELEEILKDASLETVKNFIQNTAEESFKAKQNSWKESLDPAKKRFLEIEDAFNETDKAIQMAQRLEFFDNLNLENVKTDEKLQKSIYYEYLKEKGFSDAEAMEAIDDASSVDKLQEKALKAIPSLKESTESYITESRKAKQVEVETKAKENQEAFTKLLGTIEEREEFVPGLKLNKVAKDRLKANITTSVYKDQKGNEYTSLMYKQMRNPAEFEMLINYYDTLGLFNFDNSGKFKPDITKLKNVAKSAAVSELDRVLSKENEQGVGQGNSRPISNTTKGALDLLEKAFERKK
jgi:hypothetical protein